MDTEKIVIFEKDLLLAQRICASITDLDRRNKAVANVLGAKIAAEYFDSDAYEVDIATGLHNIAPIVEQFEISDIYVNGAYIDVRVYFSDDELCVPKVHFDTGLLPVAYMFVKLSSDLKEANVTGFVYPESVNKNDVDNDVYILTPRDLTTFYDIEMRLNNPLDTEDVKNEKIYELLEGSLNEQETIDLLKIFTRSKQSRHKLVKIVNAQYIFNFVSTPEVSEPSNNVPLEIADETPVPAENVEPQQDESTDDELDLTDEDLDSLFETEDDSTQNSDAHSNQVYTTEITPSGAEVIESLNKETQDVSQESSEQIETLFTGEQEGVPVPKKKKSGFLPLLLFAVIICSGAFFWHNYQSGKTLNDDYLNSQASVEDIDSEGQEIAGEPEQNLKQEDAMPVETVEDVKPVVNKEESTSVAIPEIERNLDASVLVSNLKIDWEVPEGYASSTAAKRYFVKLGKIIQLNLKTELLLLSKPPLSNKIMVELKYNASSGKFDVVGLQMSSGEKSVDSAILQTVKNALGYNTSTNMESFSKLQGNPILIIHL